MPPGIPAVDDIRVDGHLDVCEDLLALNTTHIHGGNRFAFLTGKRRERGLAASEDWFWGGFSPQLGYTYLANVYLRRDEISSFLRQWVNNYAAFVVPIPDYCFVEHFMNHADPDLLDAIKKGDYRSSPVQPRLPQRPCIVLLHGTIPLSPGLGGRSRLWLAKATPRHWLEQGKKIAVSRAPTYFGRSPTRSFPTWTTGKSTPPSRCPRAKRPGRCCCGSAIPRPPRSRPSQSTATHGRTSMRTRK